MPQEWKSASFRIDTLNRLKELAKTEDGLVGIDDLVRKKFGFPVMAPARGRKFSDFYTKVSELKVGEKLVIPWGDSQGTLRLASTVNRVARKTGYTLFSEGISEGLFVRRDA